MGQMLFIEEKNLKKLKADAAAAQELMDKIHVIACNLFGDKRWEDIDWANNITMANIQLNAIYEKIINNDR